MSAYTYYLLDYAALQAAEEAVRMYQLNMLRPPEKPNTFGYPAGILGSRLLENGAGRSRE